MNKNDMIRKFFEKSFTEFFKNNFQEYKHCLNKKSYIEIWLKTFLDLYDETETHPLLKKNKAHLKDKVLNFFNEHSTKKLKPSILGFENTKKKKYKNFFKRYSFFLKITTAFDAIFKDNFQTILEEEEVLDLIAEIYVFFIIISLKEYKVKLKLNNNLWEEVEKLARKTLYSGIETTPETINPNQRLNCSKNQFFSEFIEILDEFLMILTHAFSLKIELKEGFMEFNIFILLGLENFDCFRTNKSKIFTKGKTKYLIEYDLLWGDALTREDPLPSFIFFKYSTKISQLPNLIFTNSNYKGCFIKLGDTFLINDSFFNISPLVHSNPKYGFMENEKVRRLNSNFIRKNTLIYDFIMEKTQDKWTIDKEFFLEVWAFFTEKILQIKGLSLTSDMKEISDTLRNYSFIASNKNKNWMGSLLKVIDLVKIYGIFNISRYIYFSFFFDTRSRFYYNSSCSITSFVFSRFFLTTDDYTPEELDKIVKNSLKSSAGKIYLDFYYENEGKISSTLNLSNHEWFYHENWMFNEYKKIVICSSLISLGFVHKSKILKKKPDFSFSLNITELFEEGLYIFKKEKEDPNFMDQYKDGEDFFTVKTYCRIISKDLDLYKKIYIGLDFSASGHQLRYIWNAFEDVNNYKLINLNSKTDWVDVYTLIINKYFKFLEQVKEGKNLGDIPNSYKNNFLALKNLLNVTPDLSFIKEFFTRKLLKKSIMTIEYNVTLTSFWEYFQMSLDEEFEEKSDFEKREIYVNSKLFLMCFYYFCKNIELFDKQLSVVRSNKELEDLIKKSEYLIKHFDDFTIPLLVSKKSDRDLRIVHSCTINKKYKRVTFQVSEFSDIMDKKATNNSLTPNFTHAFESLNLRSFIYFKWWSKTPFGHVHDEYRLPYQERFLFVDHINYIIKKDLTFLLTTNFSLLPTQVIIKKLRKQNFDSFADFKEKFDSSFTYIDIRCKDFYSIFIII